MTKIQKNSLVKFILIILIFFQLIYISSVRLSFKTEIFSKSFVKNFGSEYIMTPDILELKEITENLELKEVNISKRLKNNVFFFQRSIEFLYPIKIVNDAKKTFYSIDEKTPDNCEILNTYKHLRLITC